MNAKNTIKALKAYQRAGVRTFGELSGKTAKEIRYAKMGATVALALVSRGGATPEDLDAAAEAIKAGRFRTYPAMSGAPWIYGQAENGAMFEADEDDGLEVTYGKNDEVLSIAGAIYVDAPLER